MLAFIASLLCWHPRTASAQEADPGYRLGPEDKIRLKVFEWRPSQDVIFEWKALNDEFIVSADGNLSIPLAGQVPVRGLTPAAVAGLVAERLRARLNLSAPPDASIDIVQYRPFYVSGDVARPGPYPFKPSLTVLEAVTIAGGVLRASDFGLMRFDRDVIAQEGELLQLEREYDGLLIRRARLRAEVAGQESFAVPPEVDGSRSKGFVAQMVEAEALILKSRTRAFVTQTEALKSLKGFLIKQSESLDAQITTIDTQMALINKELTGVASLVEKGMAVAPRQLALERSVAQIQGDRLSMQTNKLRVLEEMSKTDISMIELRNNRVTEASIELRDTQLKLDSAINKSATGAKLLFEAKVTAPGLAAETQRNGRAAPKYAIVRESSGEAVSDDVGEDARLQPGDTVKVMLPVPTSTQLRALSAASGQPLQPVRESSYP